MRVPVRSEPEAFRLAWGTAGVSGLSILVGALTEPAIGVAVFGGAALGALAWDLKSVDPERGRPLHDAAHEPHPELAGDVRRVLVVANELLEGEEPSEELARRAGPRPELVVLAPVLPSRTHFAVSDVDRERADAARRLEATLAWAGRHGFAARGEVSDPIDPFASLADDLRRFGADEVLVATHPAERQNWLEPGMLRRLREELDVPVTQIVVDRAEHRIEIEAAPAV